MTYYLLLLPALAVAGVGWVARRRFAMPGQMLMVLGCLGCVAVMGWQVRQTIFPPAATAMNRAQTVVSFYLANQTQQAIAGRSGVVVLIFPPRNLMSAEAARDYANAFSAPLLRGHPEWQVQSVTLAAPAKGAGISLASFQQAIAKHPNAIAYVSYAPVAADIGELFPGGPSGAPFFLFDPEGGVNWLSALKQGRIRSVIVPRPGINLDAHAGIAGDPGGIFNQLYFIATPANADHIAAQLATGAR
jgi:hypothetical protein